MGSLVDVGMVSSEKLVPSRPKKAAALAPKVDLSRYIPLGSVTFRPVNPILIPSEDDKWIELKDDVLPLPKTGLYAHVAQLHTTGWARLFLGRNSSNPGEATVRLFLLPDDVARGHFPRTNKKSRSALRAVMASIDKSSTAWNGRSPSQHVITSYQPHCIEEDSLFYIFNTLESPHPDPTAVTDSYVADAMEDVLEDSLSERGLRTRLYPYQRRSAAMMLQRESMPLLRLDPRLETFSGPTSKTLYFDRDACHVLSEARSYHEARGGILGETMGYGKTLICLSVILATKEHCPEIPPEHSTNFENHKSVSGCRSLSLMAAATISRNNAPWRLFFRERSQRGEHFDNCVKMLEDTLGGYWIQLTQTGRRESLAKKERVYLAPTTLVVVPPNLFSQWRNEIELHLKENVLSILIITEQENFMPSSEQLARFDMILMTRTRFEEEMNGKAGQYERDDSSRCCCAKAPRRCQVHAYRSPLIDVHFLRFIVDEGHGFVASSSKTQALKGLSSIRVDRKWIVSGTPASGLIGVEVDLAAEERVITSSSDESRLHDSSSQQSGSSQSEEVGTSPTSGRSKRRSHAKASLKDRRKVVALEQERKDIERLGHIVKSFLGVKPWSNSQAQDVANWNSYVLPSLTGVRKPLSLRNVLEGLVVRHRIEDIEADLQLPPLYNTTVRLQPCFIDKLTANLFILVLASNAVTSERTDQDYMFHTKNRKPLEALIKNLRHASFFWTGFSTDDILESCKAGRKYLDDPEHVVTTEDRASLESAISVGKIALESQAWAAFSNKNEIGTYVENFPPDHISSWALTETSTRSPLLLGATQLEAVKNLVESNLYATDPTACLKKDDFNGPGSSIAITNQISTVMHESPKKRKNHTEEPMTSKGVPQSSLQESLRLTSGQFAMRFKGQKTGGVDPLRQPTKRRSSTTSDIKSVLKGNNSTAKPEIPQAYQSLSRTKLVGTSSAKLSYLMDRILALHRQEKILVFYEGDDIAYYCAQALEVLGIVHLIYASGISLKLRTEYQALFNGDQTYRVMLMDLKQAAHGLHMASASRVFFVNPVWQPNIEAQAIKRAHRIGQTRPVYVETLVLAGTLEEQLLQRRKAMSSEEHQKASKSLLDDAAINEMIKNAKPMPLTAGEISFEEKQFSALQNPQQIFGRSVIAAYGSPEAVASACIPSAASGGPDQPNPPKKRKATFVDEAEPGIIRGEVAVSSICHAHSAGLNESRRQEVQFTSSQDHAPEGSNGSEATTSSASHVTTEVHPGPPKKRRAMFADEVERPLAVAISSP